MSDPVLRQLDAVTVPVPDLDQGLAFYRDQLGHQLLWRNDALGQAGLRLPESTTELVLSTGLAYASNWLVTSVDDAVESLVAAGGRVAACPDEHPPPRSGRPRPRGAAARRERRLPVPGHRQASHVLLIRLVIAPPAPAPAVRAELSGVDET